MLYRDMWRILIFLLLTMTLAETGSSPKWQQSVCTERDANRHPIGTQLCLTVDGRNFMAQCQMSQNIPMWRKLGEGCPFVSVERLNHQPRRLTGTYNPAAFNQP